MKILELNQESFSLKNIILKFDELNQNELISNRNSTVRIILDTAYFKDRTVILMLELLIYCLCLEGDFNIYFNLRIKDKKSIAYNFYCF